jgi:hypothetical protein
MTGLLNRLIRSGLIPPALIAIGVAITATTAYAAATRAEYVAQTDPICRAALAKEQALARSLDRRVRQLEKRGVDTGASSKQVVRIFVRYFDQLAEIQRNENLQISMVTPAPGDESIVAQWLQKRQEASDLFQRGVQVFAHGKERFSKKLVGMAAKRGFLAEELVQDFGFRSCDEIPAQN